MSENRKGLVLLLVILQPLCCFSIPPYAPFDYFKLVLLWPPTYCRIKSCTPPLPQDFVIHGFWPALFNSATHLVDCAPDVEYTVITDRTLRDLLNQHWPNLEGGPDRNEDFWRAQWIKHGTCSLLFYYQMGYFDLAVELRQPYDILRRLGDAGIRPSSTSVVSVVAVRAVIQQYTTKYPQLGCFINDQDQKLLNEIHPCFTPDGEIIDCPDFGSCNRPYAFFPPPF